jgi:hypothetical protein
MANELNNKQVALLRLIYDSHNEGCILYGRPYAETAKALAARGLVRESQNVVYVASMDSLEPRRKWYVTAAGETAVVLQGRYQVAK